jgi:hypothetical protein
MQDACHIKQHEKIQVQDAAAGHLPLDGPSGPR